MKKTAISIICVIMVILTVAQVIVGKTILEAILSVLPFIGILILFEVLLLIFGYAVIKLMGK